MRCDVSVRVAEKKDAAVLAALESACFSDGWSCESLASHRAGAGGFALLAERDGEALGYLTARLLAPECELYRIAVLPISRHTGVASALMDAFFAILKAEDCPALFLEVRESNTPAIALYKKYGMTQVGMRKNYYRNPTENALLFAIEG